MQLIEYLVDIKNRLNENSQLCRFRKLLPTTAIDDVR